MARRRSFRILIWAIAILLPVACAVVWASAARSPWPVQTPIDFAVGGWMPSADGHSLAVWRVVPGSPLPPTLPREFLGFFTRRSTWSYPTGQLGAATAHGVTFGTLQILTTLPLAELITARLLRRRPRAGCCRVCGYDLRASPERCPECGTPVGAGQA